MSLTTETEDEKVLTPCQTYDPELWFADKKDKMTRMLAVSMCQMCPSANRLECLEGALERNEEHGIFGGLTPEQRAKTTLKRIA